MAYLDRNVFHVVHWRRKGRLRGDRNPGSSCPAGGRAKSEPRELLARGLTLAKRLSSSDALTVDGAWLREQALEIQRWMR